MTKTSEKYDYNSTFPSTLRALMEERKVTQLKIAEICSVKPQSVSQWRNGETRPDILSLAKIAKHFGVSTDYLLGLTDVKTTDTATKELCGTLGLSEKAIDILLCADDYADTMTKLHKKCALEYPSLGYSEEYAFDDMDRLSSMFRECINRLADDFIDALPAAVIVPNEYHCLSFVELISNFYDCIEASDGAEYEFVTLDESREFARTRLTLSEGFIEGYTKFGKPTLRFDNIQKLIIESAINDIVAKLHDIKREALAEDKERETE